MGLPKPQSVANPIGEAIVYGRVSGAHDPRTVSLETQVGEGLDLAASERYTVEEDGILTEKFTGVDSVNDRPNLVEIRRRIKDGRYAAFICHHTDRLARSPEDLLTVVSEFRRYGCKVLFVKNPSPDTREGQLLLFVLGWASENEYHQIMERTQRAKKRLKTDGKWLGTGRVRFGYVWDQKNRTRREHPTYGPVVRRIFQMVAYEGLSLQSVCDQLNAEGVPSPSVAYEEQKKSATAPAKPSRWQAGCVHTLVREPTYLGLRVEDRSTRTDQKTWSGGSAYRRDRVHVSEVVGIEDDAVDALVDRATFDAAQAALKRRSHKAATTRNVDRPFLFRGLATCGGCGRGMRVCNVKSRPKTSHYQCGSYAHSRRHGTERTCGMTIRAHILEPMAWSAVEHVIMTPGVIEAGVERVLNDDSDRPIRDQLEANMKATADARKRVKNLTISLAGAASEEVREAIMDGMNLAGKEVDRFVAQRARLEDRLRPYSNKERTAARLREVADQVRARLGTDHLDFAQKRDIMEQLGVGVVVSPDRTIRVRIACGGPAGQDSTPLDSSSTALKKYDLPGLTVIFDPSPCLLSN